MTEPEQWARELLDAVFDASDLGSACGIVDCPQCANAAISIQRAFEERERKLRDRHLADLGEALDHLLQDVELEDALTAVGIGVYGPDATKFEKMFAAAMKCRERFAALKETPDAG